MNYLIGGSGTASNRHRRDDKKTRKEIESHMVNLFAACTFRLFHALRCVIERSDIQMRSKINIRIILQLVSNYHNSPLSGPRSATPSFVASFRTSRMHRFHYVRPSPTRVARGRSERARVFQHADTTQHRTTEQ